MQKPFVEQNRGPVSLIMTHNRGCNNLLYNISKLMISKFSYQKLLEASFLIDYLFLTYCLMVAKLISGEVIWARDKTIFSTCEIKLTPSWQQNRFWFMA